MIGNNAILPEYMAWMFHRQVKTGLLLSQNAFRVSSNINQSDAIFKGINYES